MSSEKITNLASGTVKLTDVYPAVDVTDSSMAPSGTDKKYTVSQLSTFINDNVLTGLIQTQDFTFSVSGAIAPRSFDVTFYRVGNIVMMKYLGFAALVTTPSASISSLTAFPAGFVPDGAGSFDIFQGVTAVDGTTGVEIAPGAFSLYPAPSFSFHIGVYAPNSALSGFSSTYAGIKGGSIIYFGS